jgi:signal transduction histidine kinase
VWPNGDVRVLHQLGEVKHDAKGRPVKMIGTTQDVTEINAARAELMESKLKAETANQAKSRFVASMSHELRTPLNAIIGFSELLQSDDAPLSDDRRKEYAHDIHTSGKHLLSVINDILDISRIEAGKVSLDEEETSISDLIESAYRMVRPRAEETGVAVARSVDPKVTNVLADRRLLLQTLLNLTSNAVKFTERGGRVDITAQPAKDGGVDIVVRDTGIGMSADDIARVGEPFLQVDGRLSRKFEGTGLGLVIAKRLVEMHGGALCIESVVGTGTTMTIRLPASRNLSVAKKTVVNA